MSDFDIIHDVSQVRIGDRIRWSYRGDGDFGEVTKINPRTFLCASSNKSGRPVLVSRALVFEVLRKKSL